MHTYTYTDIHTVLTNAHIYIHRNTNTHIYIHRHTQTYTQRDRHTHSTHKYMPSTASYTNTQNHKAHRMAMRCRSPHFLT